ncbi:MAG: hypothetical protein ACLFNQ_00130 [Spirochaetaceae bacterium]
MRKALLVAITFALVLAGCDNGSTEAAGPEFAPDQTAEAYIYIHGGYVGQAIASTNSDGEISVELDEAFLPHTLAAVDLEEDEWNEDNTVSYVVRGSENFVAKYIEYNGTNYVGTTVGTSVTYVEADEDGEPAGQQDLELLIIRDQGSMAEYFDVIQDEGFGIMTEFGGSVEPVTTTSYGQVTKRGSSYWNFGLGWQGNIDAIESFIAENGFNYNLDDVSRAEEPNDEDLRPWSVADTVTGATLSDFTDYFALAQMALAQLERN